jgi:hypothetical protein
MVKDRKNFSIKDEVISPFKCQALLQKCWLWNSSHVAKMSRAKANTMKLSL